MHLGRLAHADVADGRGDEDALGALERAQHDLDRELGPVLAARDELDAGADLLGEGVGRGARVVGDQPLGEALRDDVADLLPDELVAAVAELLLGLQVEQDDLAGLVDDDHRVGGRLEQAAVAAFHLARCFSAAWRTLMSRMAAVTSVPSALSSGLSIISMGNSVRFLRRAISSMPRSNLLGQGCRRRCACRRRRCAPRSPSG